MYLVAIAWMYVVLMMAVAEALSSQGTLLGAFFTLLLYGLLPLGVVLYIMGTPLRRRARNPAPAPQDAAPDAAAAPGLASARSQAPDASRVTPGDAVAPERKEA
jgi:hypothetical protein